MNNDSIQILIAMIVYIVAILGIGVYFLKIANENSDNYFIGGRSLGPWVAAMSAEASDMSGWLLMGLPGVAYWCGFADAFWTALGLALGTYLNWKITAKRLRNYSSIAGDAITIPEYFSNRFKENRKVIMLIASIFILVFFTVYAASCFVTVGKLFNSLFGIQYQVVMIAGAFFVILYTLLGGFLAESVSDFMQGVIMFIAIILVLVMGAAAAGGFGAVMTNIQSIPGFFDFFGIASPTLVDGVQQVSATGDPLFGAALPYTFLTIISTMSWGLGYFGVPQVLLRFIAIRDADEIPKARRIATSWCVISLFAAVMFGMIGRVLFPTELLTPSGAESIFIVMATNLMPPLIAGFVMAGILAATMSSSDSYLLIAASAFSKNIYEGILKKNASDKEIMRVSHIILISVAVIGVLLALDENSVIFTIVAFAWAGFGATFGPLMLFSLFWKRTTREGAIAGMLAGGGMVFIWRLLIKPLGGVFGIYELLPAFLVSCAFIVVVSLLSKEPSAEIQAEFEQAKAA
ncbi:sodium/proline symporter PutP [Acetobacterium fimetarium]|uniref:Sodium/proline symporter n=1 Tax=Acetobacterium fimetarium TaxID=52691 RepID=A0ABR6WXU5_9FIRM|nr:sodium/proline symporter PutP [Acetobacterium fimetarium]MBC3805049.1 sodium/proline symporter PutP [Acetobacterium fimetarium]